MSDKEEILQAIQSLRGEMGNWMTHVETQIVELRSEVKAEVKRWDDRFFEFAKESANRANTFIASAAIAIVGGVILLILRTG